MDRPSAFGADNLGSNPSEAILQMNKLILTITLIIVSALFTLLITRATSPREIDDISPEIPCEQELMEKSDILWVIPKFNNIPITENTEWCNKILSLNKTLGLHGVRHTFEEFKINRNEEYLNEGISIFEECFGEKPTMFKPPQLKISKNNKELIRNNNLKLKVITNQVFHKVYHCQDTGRFSNKFINRF
jgi:predicted deacetylase